MQIGMSDREQHFYRMGLHEGFIKGQEAGTKIASDVLANRTSQSFFIPTPDTGIAARARILEMLADANHDLELHGWDEGLGGYISGLKAALSGLDKPAEPTVTIKAVREAADECFRYFEDMGDMHRELLKRLAEPEELK